MPAETVSDNVETLINLALAEDFGSGDVTSTYFVPEHLTARAILTPRKKGVLSGVNVAAEVFRKVDPTLKVEVYLHDGEAVAPGAVVMLIEGSARSILGAERTALNFIQRLSGVATLTRQYVKAISHTSARILDTRKTTPGYRLLEKAAVLHGGGTNHRMGLYARAMEIRNTSRNASTGCVRKSPVWKSSWKRTPWNRWATSLNWKAWTISFWTT